MQKSYVYQLVQTLEEDESTTIREWIDTPFFNRQLRDPQLVGELLEILQREVVPGKQELNEQFFPEEGDNPNKLNKLMSELASLIKQFLEWNEFQQPQHDFEREMAWLKIVRKRGLLSRYQQQLNALQKTVKKEVRETVGWYYNRFLLDYEVHETQSIQNNSRGDLHLPAAIQSLNAYALTHRLELLNLLLLQQKITVLDIPATIQALNGELPAETVAANYPLAHIFSLIYHQLSNQRPTAESFDEILQLLDEHQDKLEEATLQNCYAYLRNICTLLLQAGRAEYATVLHQIQRDNLAKGFLFYKGMLSPHAYLSVTQIALQVGEHEWALQFVEQYKDHLIDQGDEQENYFLLNKALCWFAQGKYEELLDILPTQFTNISYHLTSKRLELKAYFETDSELLPYRIDSYKMYVSRASKKVISPKIKELEKNFVNILLQLSQSPISDKERFRKIRRRIQDKIHIAEKAWLMEVTGRRI